MKEGQPNLLKYNYECDFADMNKITRLSFFENYTELLKWSDEWKTKLEFNLSILEGEKERVSHLESVKKGIEYELEPKNVQDSLEPYLKCYDLEIDNFPFIGYSKIETILSKECSDGDECIIDECKDEKMDLRSMKLDFFVYAINSEIFKIIDFIDERLPKIGVFQTKFAEELFNKLLKYLNIEDKIKRGDQAKLAGIYESTKAKKLLFKKAILKKEYLEYINNRFGEKYKTKSFSSGDNHSRFVDSWINKKYYSSL